MQKQIDDLKKCIKEMEKTHNIFSEEFIKLGAEIKLNTKLTKETHRAVYGNGNPEKSMLTRVARNEAKLWVIFGILIPMGLVFILELLKKI